MLPKCSSEILFSWVQLDLLNHFQPEKCWIGQLMFGVPLPLSLYLCTLTFRHTYIPGFGWPYTCDRTLHTVCDLWVVHTVHVSSWPTCLQVISGTSKIMKIVQSIINAFYCKCAMYCVVFEMWFVWTLKIMIT